MLGLYYQNQFETALFPIMTNKVFSVDKKQSKFQKVVDMNFNLDKENFRKYLPTVLPLAFRVNHSLGTSLFAALVVHFTLLF